MNLSDLVVQPTQVRVSGASASLEMESPFPGVLRLRHAPCSLQSSSAHPRFNVKTSFAVLSGEPQPITAREDAGVLKVSAPGARLELARETGRWRFSDE